MDVNSHISPRVKVRIIIFKFLSFDRNFEIIEAEKNGRFEDILAS